MRRLILISPAVAEKPSLGVSVMPQVAANSVLMIGSYRALIIRTDQYQHGPNWNSYPGLAAS